MYVHEIKLPEKDEFSKKFNYVSWLWQKSNDQSLTEEKRKFYEDNHFDAKLALEQGYPISYLNEYKK